VSPSAKRSHNRSGLKLKFRHDLIVCEAISTTCPSAHLTRRLRKSGRNLNHRKPRRYGVRASLTRETLSTGFFSRKGDNRPRPGMTLITDLEEFVHEDHHLVE
jgi:hypothetical protein